jgi:hypothetical protein
LTERLLAERRFTDKLIDRTSTWSTPFSTICRAFYNFCINFRAFFAIFSRFLQFFCNF